MSSPNFIDYVKVYLRAGKGGAGVSHFMRAKFVPKGGPDGGDGGRGGHIILRGDKQRSTLLHLKYRKYIAAINGQPGGDGCKTGASGKDIILDVPLGTVAKRGDQVEVLVEILEDNQKYILMQGGKGGWGNTHFKSPTHQAPHIAYPGEPGMEDWMVLELKLLADVGLVGLPNVGKSTLLSVVSAAKPRIDNYPFTTLVPNLGVIAYRNDHSLVMADIPGIIEGAAAGKGLGTRFLRHIERNSVLLFMISATSENICVDYAMLCRELAAYNPFLLEKPRLLAISKIDLLDHKGRASLLQALPQDIERLCISSSTGEGIAALKDAIWKKLHPK
ncbi:GTPase ObgE [Candidatus Cardinium hertigii]|jgi:GTP-binding protein|uniref:GTPase Obg n=1 Tax=Candidatus Cardinium hertigii TaxID=247481 RepID=A0A3N2QCY9_9BACT|nr:GTPase ObgE [Candidatus Cardinium hertigii]ROT47462.1 GTPase ObgE [Candidatus Cardinium hertigii]